MAKDQYLWFSHVLYNWGNIQSDIFFIQVPYVIPNYCHSELLSFRIIVIPNYFHSELLSFQTTVISNYCHFEYPNNTTYCLLVLPPLLAPALATALPKAEKIGRHICEYSLIYFSLNCTVSTLYEFFYVCTQDEKLELKKLYQKFLNFEVESRNLMHQENCGKMFLP